MNDVQLINIEFYAPYKVQLDNICIITLFKKILTENFYEHKDTIENFKKDEELFISWLASISSSKNYPLTRAVLVDSGFTIEAIYSSIKSRHFIEHPYLSRVKRIYVIDKLRIPNEVDESKVSSSTEEIDNDQKPKEAIKINLLLDFSNDELYLFFSPIIVVDSAKAEALVIETDRGIEFLRLDNLPSTKLMKTSIREMKRKRGKKKKRKRKSKKSRKTSRALS